MAPATAAGSGWALTCTQACRWPGLVSTTTRADGHGRTWHPARLARLGPDPRECSRRYRERPRVESTHHIRHGCARAEILRSIPDQAEPRSTAGSPGKLCGCDGESSGRGSAPTAWPRVGGEWLRAKATIRDPN